MPTTFLSEITADWRLFVFTSILTAKLGKVLIMMTVIFFIKTEIWSLGNLILHCKYCFCRPKKRQRAKQKLPR